MAAPLIDTTDTIRRRAPRLAGDARRAQIVDAACCFFADNGFSGPTRDLAASIGVTQALLYRYFDSKTDLIDAVFAQVFKNHWSDGALELFEETAGEPMVERLVAVYADMLPRMTSAAIRLLFRAGLDNYAKPIYLSANKGRPLLVAVLAAWRAEEGFPSFEEKPMLEGERMLPLALHNAMIMIRVREHIFHSVRALDDLDDIRQVAESHDLGARAILRRLHAGEASERRIAIAMEPPLEPV